MGPPTITDECGCRTLSWEGPGKAILVGGMLGIRGSQESHPKAAFAGKHSVSAEEERLI